MPSLMLATSACLLVGRLLDLAFAFETAQLHQCLCWWENMEVNWVHNLKDWVLRVFDEVFNIGPCLIAMKLNIMMTIIIDIDSDININNNVQVCKP
jgi:hypothetical protein